MQVIAEILGKKVQIEYSDAAAKAMETLSTPLLVEMELYFSCLIRKAVRFNETESIHNGVVVTPKLTVGFRPVATKACNVADFDVAPPLEDFAIVKPEAFVPKKLSIDFKRGKWTGEFQMA